MLADTMHVLWHAQKTYKRQKSLKIYIQNLKKNLRTFGIKKYSTLRTIFLLKCNSSIPYAGHSTVSHDLT